MFSRKATCQPEASLSLRAGRVDGKKLNEIHRRTEERILMMEVIAPEQYQM